MFERERERERERGFGALYVWWDMAIDLWEFFV